MNFFSIRKRSLFLIHDTVGVKLLTRLWLQLSHLNEYKFCNNFKGCMIPIYDCGAETETTCHFFLCFQFFAHETHKLHGDVYQIDTSIKNLKEESLINTLLYDCDSYNGSKNKQILLHIIFYI